MIVFGLLHDTSIQNLSKALLSDHAYFPLAFPDYCILSVIDKHEFQRVFETCLFADVDHWLVREVFCFDSLPYLVCRPLS